MSQIIRVKSFKAWGGRTKDQQWVNTYDVAVMDGDLVLADPAWPLFAAALVNRELSFHLPMVNSMRVVLSTLDAEAEYSHRNLRVIETTGVGMRSVPSGEQPLPLDIALKCKKNAALGRNGTTFYRGALHTGDITVAAGGNPTLNDPIAAELINGIGLMITQDLLPTLETLQGEFIMPNPEDGVGGAETVRVYTQILPSGVSVNRRDHRYFDRQDAPAPA